ncbi:unnamed protein product [Mycena citricolor]|uniref:Uncharacterized protein n=1 Tax=Mycena citricolor TaxID=2018698 RepID=A0AAD2H2P6_9AGAR|nr:unnamed protein product [Mycena citricolor]
MSTSQEMLFFGMEIAPEVTEERFNDWYDNEHVPLRLTLAGLNAVTRYKATDGQVPTWLTMYDCDTAAVFTSEAYASIAALASDNEKEILTKITGMSRRIYRHLSTNTAPGVSEESLPSKFVLVAGLEVSEGDEDELNKWYSEEHIDMLSKIPGWRQCRRYKIIEYKQVGAVMEGKPVCKYLAIHEFEKGDFLQTPELQNATTTDWAKRMMSKVVNHEKRVFALHKGCKSLSK